ncbi:hypothetical protein JCM8208_000255 [Rhodotorula glutinis]
MFLCLPIVFGVNTKLKQEGDEVRQCQNCHNRSCVRVKRSKRFELFWIPLVPLGSKHIWMCHICSPLLPSSSRPVLTRVLADPLHMDTEVSYAADPAEKDAPASAQYAAAAPPHGGQPAPGRGYDVGYQGQGAKV